MDHSCMGLAATRTGPHSSSLAQGSNLCHLHTISTANQAVFALWLKIAVPLCWSLLSSDPQKPIPAHQAL